MPKVGKVGKKKRRRVWIQNEGQRRARSNGPRAAFLIRKEKLAALGYASYEEYVASLEWTRRREDYYERNARSCAVCDHSNGVMYLHHLTYVRIGRENDGDLAPLCRRCHGLVHAHPDGFGFKVLVAMRAAFRRTGDPSTALSERLSWASQQATGRVPGGVVTKTIATLSEEERKRYAIDRPHRTC